MLRRSNRRPSHIYIKYIGIHSFCLPISSKLDIFETYFPSSIDQIDREYMRHCETTSNTSGSEVSYTNYKPFLFYWG